LWRGCCCWSQRRSPGRDRANLTDALIITIGLGLLSWVFLLDPYVQAPGLSQLVKAVSAAYPLSDLLVLAVAVRLVVGTGTRPPAFYLLAGGLLTLLGTDTGYVLLQLNGAYQSGGPIDSGWMLACLLLGAAALHPSMRTLSTPDQQGRTARLSRARLAMLAAAAMMAPGVLVLQALQGQPIDVPVIAAASVLLFGLTMTRLASLAGEIAAQAERSRSLDRLRAVIDACPIRQPWARPTRSPSGWRRWVRQPVSTGASRSGSFGQQPGLGSSHPVAYAARRPADVE